MQSPVSVLFCHMLSEHTVFLFCSQTGETKSFQGLTWHSTRMTFSHSETALFKGYKSDQPSLGQTQLGANPALEAPAHA